MRIWSLVIPIVCFVLPLGLILFVLRRRALEESEQARAADQRLNSLTEAGAREKFERLLVEHSAAIVVSPAQSQADAATADDGLPRHATQFFAKYQSVRGADGQFVLSRELSDPHMPREGHQKIGECAHWGIVLLRRADGCVLVHDDSDPFEEASAYRTVYHAGISLIQSAVTD